MKGVDRRREMRVQNVDSTTTSTQWAPPALRRYTAWPNSPGVSWNSCRKRAVRSSSSDRCGLGAAVSLEQRMLNGRPLSETILPPIVPVIPYFIERSCEFSAGILGV